MKINAPFLSHPDVSNILKIFNSNQYQTLIAGGAVRNTLMGISPKDIDLATTLLPDETIKVANTHSLRSIPTGYDHGTITVISGNTPFEITTLRRDADTDGRHATVEYGASFQEDAERRDFTINALFLDKEGEVIDYVNGIKDIESRKIRFVGDATSRIREDYLRIMRYFRFLSTYGTRDRDLETLKTIKQESHGLQKISIERIFSELSKTLFTKNSPYIVDQMVEAKIFDTISPFLIDIDTFKRSHSLGLKRILPIHLFGSLYSDTTDTDLKKFFKLSNDDHVILKNMNEHTRTNDNLLEEKNIKSLTYLLGKKAFSDLLIKKFITNNEMTSDIFDNILNKSTSFHLPKNPFSGKNLLDAGLSPGKNFGKILLDAEMTWIEHDFPSDKKILENILSSSIQKYDSNSPDTNDSLSFSKF